MKRLIMAMTLAGLAVLALIGCAEIADPGVQRAAGSVTVQGLLLPSSTTVTVTDGTTITPTTSVYLLDSASAVTVTLAACSNAGQPLWLYGKDNNTVTITDTNILTTDGNAATLGQYDVIQWLCNGTAWAHVAKSANQ